MNLNILPAAVTTAKTSVSAATGSSSASTSAATDISTTAGTGATSPADFASQLEAQLGEKVDPKITSTLAKLGQQIADKGVVVDKTTLTQAVASGEEDGSLMLDESDLSKMIAAIQILPAGNLKGAGAASVKDAALSDKDKDSADAGADLSVQSLLAQLAVQQQPAQQIQTTAVATQTLRNDTPATAKQSALLSGLTASSLLTGEGKTAAVTDTDPKAAAASGNAASGSAQHAASNKATTGNTPDFSSALASMSAAAGNAAALQQNDSRTTDISSQALNQLNTAAVAVSSAPVSTTPTATSAVTAPSTPLLNAQLGTPEWQQQLSQQVMMFNRQGQQSAELRLHPADLGSIQISMKIENNQAQLHFVSGHSGVRSAIEAAMPELKTALADNGISLGQSSVGSDSSQWQQAQQQSQSGSQQGNAASWAAFSAGSNTTASDALPVPASLASRVGGNNSVDIFA
ncbi:FliK family flagellar hook-length control protein [Rahnella aquatilis CIP 78.65 = ATCC 33071]|uniref:Flagellar hook-length control protein n=1 Tax=Rahnella aquatilis (strain ATCC 33071 / DSM 4594 / JCM 1683 / NBRC 105701 / NCIMB 13365 / CIP 78.65) TaxID=745277 RepID=H2IQ21_RAHAC|nr:flagellar hook-length control protein FliK [Rahnella aquatilis]AEX52406.1 flagellar hook-length control protein [Rahnella aquatilis CIP 78.65 = ATCC 33071]KFD08016.1 FliK family flagellar hook-length control protein [Rahnella aquatilis CIP 78.65 = ATCC 33071]